MRRSRNQTGKDIVHHEGHEEHSAAEPQPNTQRYFFTTKVAKITKEKFKNTKCPYFVPFVCFVVRNNLRKLRKLSTTVVRSLSKRLVGCARRTLSPDGAQSAPYASKNLRKRRKLSTLVTVNLTGHHAFDRGRPHD
jgi:hypothetical protein